jgi:hypothetical protein
MLHDFFFGPAHKRVGGGFKNEYGDGRWADAMADGLARINTCGLENFYGQMKKVLQHKLRTVWRYVCHFVIYSIRVTSRNLQS